MAGHSPLPWVWDSSKDELYSSVSNLVIAHFLEDADAAFIAQACNAHDDLLAACEAYLAQIADPRSATVESMTRIERMMRSAIAKARGEEVA